MTKPDISYLLKQGLRETIRNEMIQKGETPTDEHVDRIVENMVTLAKTFGKTIKENHEQTS